MLPPQYFGSIAYYVTMSQYGRVKIVNSLRHDKRFKSVHRCDIADVNGPLQLTVPLSKESPAAEGMPRRWCDMRVSSHAGWWSDHIVSLESAYGRTPFFEFYFDRFRPWISDNHLPITQLNAALDREVRRILSLDCEVEYVDGDTAVSSAALTMPPYPTRIVEYYQVRRDRLGFIPSLSILDLIFNLGPEAPLILKAMQPQ